MADEGEITLLLREFNARKEGAQDRLMERVHSDLVRLADIHMQRRFGAKRDLVTLEPTELVSETYLRLIKQRQQFDSSGHFFAIVTRIMLRVLVDYQRSRRADKRFGAKTRVSLSDIHAQGEAPFSTEATELSRALGKLEALDGRSADVLKLRVIWGLSNDEVARALDVSRSTVVREWRFARGWLLAELTG